MAQLQDLGSIKKPAKAFHHILKGAKEGQGGPGKAMGSQGMQGKGQRRPGDAKGGHGRPGQEGKVREGLGRQVWSSAGDLWKTREWAMGC